MILNKIVSLSFLFSFLLIANISLAQSPQKDIPTQNEISKPIKKSSKMKLAPSSAAKSRDIQEKQKKHQLTKSRKVAKKNDRLYSSKSRIERARMDLQRKRKTGKLSEKEAQLEEKRIAKSETELNKKTKNASSFSKKLKPNK